MASRIRPQTGGEIGRVWLIEAGARLWGPLGIGVEFFGRPTLFATTRGQSFNASCRQTERLVIGVLRARAVAADRVAVDLVGGGGGLFQHHELELAPCFTGCAASHSSVNRRAPAFAIGFDVPFQLVPHIELTGLTRFYALRRDEHVGQPRAPVVWQLETKPSALMFIGMSARATW